MNPGTEMEMDKDMYTDMYTDMDKDIITSSLSHRQAKFAIGALEPISLLRPPQNRPMLQIHRRHTVLYSAALYHTTSLNLKTNTLGRSSTTELDFL